MLKIFLSFLIVSTIGAGLYFTTNKFNKVEKLAEQQSTKGSIEQLQELVSKSESLSDFEIANAKQTLQEKKSDSADPLSKPESLESQLAENSSPEKSEMPIDETISLWEKNDLSQDDAAETDNTVEHEEHIQADTEALAKLQVGQVLEFFVPQLGESFQSEIESTSNQLGDVKVWKGNLQGENQEDGNFIITQGKVMTHVILATNDGTYNAHIDNKTGDTTIIDDREYSSRISDTDDSIPYPHESETSE